MDCLGVCGAEEANGKVEMWDSPCIFPARVRPVIKKKQRQKIVFVLLPIRKVAKAVTAVLKNFSDVLIYDSNSHSQSVFFNCMSNLQFESLSILRQYCYNEKGINGIRAGGPVYFCVLYIHIYIYMCVSVCLCVCVCVCLCSVCSGNTGQHTKCICNENS